jgi:thymidylate synthase (FAD)
MTPFEAMVFTFDVKCPIFVARQWMRHRHASINEESLRYCAAERDYFIPYGLNQQQLAFWKMYNDEQFDRYNLLKQTMPKEQARSILPLGTYTKFYWTVNGRSLMNFLKLRLDKSAQAEIREYARAILDMVKVVAPVSFTEFVPLVLKD